VSFLKTWKPNALRLLFANQIVRPMSANKVVQRKLWPILHALKIPRCGLHAFRHTHSSLLVEGGAPVSVAQAQLRHADPRITLGIYSHVIGNSQRDAVEKLAGILRPNAPRLKPDGEWIQMCVRTHPLQNVPETWFTTPGWTSPARSCRCHGRNGRSWKNACDLY